MCGVILALGLRILMLVMQMRQMGRMQIVTENVVRVGVFNREYMRILGVVTVCGIRANYAQNNCHAEGPRHRIGGVNQRENDE